MQQDAYDRWRILAEWGVEGTGFERFMTYLIPKLKLRFGLDPGEFACPSDPAGNAPGEKDEKTCFAIMRANGFKPLAAPQDLETRLGSVRKGFDTLIDGVPMLTVDPECVDLIKGFEGGYMFARTRQGELEAEPKKNRFSHKQDCVQYVMGFYEGGTLKGTARRKLRQHDAFDKPIVKPPDWDVFASERR
jgi:hypothetical protein